MLPPIGLDRYTWTSKSVLLRGPAKRPEGRPDVRSWQPQRRNNKQGEREEEARDLVRAFLATWTMSFALHPLNAIDLAFLRCLNGHPGRCDLRISLSLHPGWPAFDLFRG